MSTLDSYMAPTTVLQAINVIMEAMGRNPVGSLDAPGSDAQMALRRLGESNIETQAEGWSFNTDEGMPIAPGSDGSITLPEGTLAVSMIRSGAEEPSSGAPEQQPPGIPIGKRLVRRGNKLYDRIGHTFNILDPTLNPGINIYVDLTVVLDFEDLPQQARWYITLKAARRACAGKLVSGTVYQFTEADEQMARLRMEQEEDAATELDTLAGNPHIQQMRIR